MERFYRKVSVLLLVIATIALALHMAGVVLRMNMDNHAVYAADLLGQLGTALALPPVDWLIVFVLQKTWLLGLIAQGCFLLSQLCIELHDVAYAKAWMGETAETQIEFLKNNEKSLLGFLDRLIPIAALLFLTVYLVQSWIGSLPLISLWTQWLTNRALRLSVISLTSAFWGAALVLSFIISFIFSVTSVVKC